LQHDDRNPKFYLTLGRIYAKKGKFSLAGTNFRHSIELDSESFEAYLELARVYQALRNWPEAQNHYQQAFVLTPQDERLQFDYADFLFSQGRFDQALPLVIKLTSSSEFKKGQIWDFIGDIHLQMKNIMEAQSAYEKSYQQNPSNYLVNVKLGEIDFSRGEIRPALERFNASRNIFLAYSHRDMRLLHHISDCYVELGQFDEAAETLQEILRRSPKDFAAYQKLSSLPGIQIEDFF
jgi:Tfp pilus assembly protein PilF